MEAKSLAEKLGFEHHTLDIREEFKSTIIANFIDEYIHGRTPNPCVLCNAYVKWGLLMNEMRKRECNYIATGHYAQIQQENGRYFLQNRADVGFCCVYADDELFCYFGVAFAHYQVF